MISKWNVREANRCNTELDSSPEGGDGGALASSAALHASRLNERILEFRHELKSVGQKKKTLIKLMYVLFVC